MTIEKNVERDKWLRLRFARWLALPISERPEDCRTQGQFAKLVNIPRPKLDDWKREEGFWDEVYKEACNLIGDELNNIVKAMVREATIGSVNAAKLCLSMLDLDRPLKVRIEEPLTVILTKDAEDRTEP